MTTRRVKEVRANNRRAIEGGLSNEQIEVTALGDSKPVYISGETLILKIPELPPKEYNQNSRAHWRVKAAAGKYYKQLVVSELPRENWSDIGPLESARMKVIYHVDQNRHMDQDNAISRLKPAIDGLVASGLFTDDEHITIIEPVLFEKTQDEPWLELQLIDYRKSVANQAPTGIELK